MYLSRLFVSLLAVKVIMARLASSLICRQSLRNSIISISVRLSSNVVDVSCPVSSYNEWDPLEEIIVGRAEGQRIPFLHPILQVSRKAFVITFREMYSVTRVCVSVCLFAFILILCCTYFNKL